MEEKNLTGKESLELIEEMIHKVRSDYHESGTSAIMWGGIIIFCSLYSIVSYYWLLPFRRYIWFLTIIAVIPQIILSIKESRRRKFKTYTDDAMSGIWTSFGISVGLVFFYTYQFPAQNTNSIFIILYGIPTFATGITHQFKPMIFGGLLCWMFAIVSFYTNNYTDVILFGLSALFAWFIPGLILRSKYVKARKNVQ